VRLSVVVPSVNGAETLDRCVDAIRDSMLPGDELIVVDEPAGGGPARRRNEGARRASGDVLVFVDSDVVCHPDALGAIRAAFRDDPKLDGVFGCYDDVPSGPGTVSTFRNLLHHHVHVESAGPASTFWSGLGGIRRETFEASGGFDATRYPRPMVEDIELGLRILDAGGRIELHGDIRGTHLKQWTLAMMLRTDLLHRGVPWTRLLIERRSAPATLNLAWHHRVSALAYLALTLLPFASPRLGPRRTALTSAALMGVTITLNRDFYRLLLRRGGPGLGMTGVALHAAHHLASVTALPVAAAEHAAAGWNRVRSGPSARAFDS
jgi:glycosyltransferase involved in cell wall biosynthesis